MNKSNRSSDQPRTDATSAFRFCLASTGSDSSILFESAIDIYPSNVPENLRSNSASDKFRRPLGVERLDPLLEVIRLAQTAVAMAFQFDRNRQRRVLGVVEEFLGGSLRQRQEGAELVDELVGRFFKLGIRNAFGSDAPVK